MEKWRWIDESQTGTRQVWIVHADGTETGVQTYDKVKVGDIVESITWLEGGDSLDGVVTEVEIAI